MEEAEVNSNLAGFITAALVLVLAFAAPGFMQDVSGQASSDTTFVSRSELVLVPVVVKDKSGNHVAGLKKSDFAVLEDGKSKGISLFEEVRTTGKIEVARGRAEGQFSNFVAADESPRRLLIIVFDTINTPFLQQARAREELIDFLSKSLKHDEPVALVSLGSTGVRQIHPFTTDSKVLVAALLRVKARSAPLEGADLAAASNASFTPTQESDIDTETNAIKEFQNEGPGDFVRFRQKENVRETMRGMQEIAHAYAGVPGRKSMIWATSGFPFLLDDPRSLIGFDASMIDSYERTWKALNQANIAVYPVDLKGVLNYVYEERFDPSLRMPRRSASIAAERHQQQQTSMQSFANATGGRACLDRNDLGKCFDLASEDSEAYYLIGYYLGNEQRKAGWHKLKVEVRGDHRVRARSGFYVADQKAVKSADLKQELGTALAANLDYTGIHFDLKWGETVEAATKPGSKKQAFSLTITPSAISIDEANNNHMNVEFAALVNDDKGKYVTEIAKHVTADLKKESVAQIRKSGLAYRHYLELAPGNYTVKFVVRDNASGRMGTVSAPLAVQ